MSVQERAAWKNKVHNRAMLVLCERSIWQAITVVVLLASATRSLAAVAVDPGTIAGQVTDSTGEPLGGVTVTIVQLNRQVISDDDGKYSLTRVPAGTYIVAYARLGFAPQRRDVVVGNGRTTTIDIALQASAFEVAAISVTATPRASDPQSTAPDLAVLGGHEKLRRQEASLGGSLEHLPGVANIATGKQAGKPVIRGLSGNRVRILSDGVAMDFQQYGVRHWANVDPFLAERIEVVRGASSVLYGSDAIGGVVNVIPRSIPHATGGSAFVRGRILGEYSGNNGELAGGVALEGAAGDVGWTGSLVRRSAGNVRTPNTPTAEQTGVGTDPRFSGLLNYTDYDQLSGSIGIGYHARVGTFAATYTGWRDEHNFLLPTGDGVGQRLENDVVLGKATLAPLQNWLIHPTVSYLRNVRQSNRPGAARDQLPDAVVVDIELQSYTGRLEAEHSALGPLAGRIGLEYGFQDQHSRGVELLVPSATIRNFAAFFYEEVRLHRFSLSLGGRYDSRYQRAAPDDRLRLPDYEIGETDAALQQSYQVVTGSVGLAYMTTDDLTIAVNAGTGFRAPSIFELHAYGSHGGGAAFQIGNPSVEREASINTDLSFRWQSRRLQAKLTGYRNGIRTYIYLVNTETVDSVTGIPIMRAIQGDAVLWGMDASLQAQLLP